MGGLKSHNNDGILVLSEAERKLGQFEILRNTSIAFNMKHQNVENSVR